MGYQTDYTLTAQLLIAGKVAELKDETPLLALIKHLREANEQAECSLTDSGSSSGNESRWYEHEADMKNFSANHPNILFTLHGEGDESGDVWNKYFLNGKVQVAKASMQIAEFNPTELK